MAEKRKALGRGISSLIPNKAKQTNTAPQAAAQTPKPTANNSLQELPLSQIQVNPKQPRRFFKQEALEELSASIKQSGVLQPILVKKTTTGYEIIAGERRYRASKMAGKQSIPVVIKDLDEQSQLEVAIVENLQRQDLSPIEEAKGYERLQEEFKLNQEQIAQKVGKDRSSVANLMRLLKLSPMVQAYVNQGKLGMGHARALLGIKDSIEQERAAEKIVQEDMSVRAVEAWIKQINDPRAVSKTAKQMGMPKAILNPNLRFLQENIQRSLGTKIEIRPKGNKGGELVIRYFNDADLTRIGDKLKNS